MLKRKKKKDRQWVKGKAEVKSESLCLIPSSTVEVLNVRPMQPLWYGSSWKALAVAAATCWLLIENRGLPLGSNTFSFF